MLAGLKVGGDYVKRPINDMLPRFNTVYIPPKNTHAQYNTGTWSQGLSIPPENINR